MAGIKPGQVAGYQVSPGANLAFIQIPSIPTERRKAYYDLLHLIVHHNHAGAH